MYFVNSGFPVKPQRVLQKLNVPLLCCNTFQFSTHSPANEDLSKCSGLTLLSLFTWTSFTFLFLFPPSRLSPVFISFSLCLYFSRENTLLFAMLAAAENKQCCIPRQPCYWDPKTYSRCGWLLSLMFLQLTKDTSHVWKRVVCIITSTSSPVDLTTPRQCVRKDVTGVTVL